MEALTGTLARQASVRVSGHVKSVNFAAVPRASASGRPSARLNIVARSSDPVGRKKSTRAPSPTQVAAVDAPPTATAPSIDLSQEYEAAATAVRLASKLCDAVQSQLKSAEKMEKDDSSPVTVADYGAQALVAWSLQRTLPHQKLSMIAEEDSVDLKASEGAAMLRRITDLVNETLAGEPDAPAVLTSDEVIALIDQGNSEGGPTGRHWVLDPIDGTRGFVSMRQYAVCLGLLVDGEVLLGVLGAPNLPHWAIADGCGAFAGPLFDMDGLPDHRIHCDDSLAPEEVRYMESFEKKHSNHKLAFAISEEVGIELPSLRIDSQAKYGALSRGDASIFMRFPPEDYREKIWDHAAGAIIVTEAGACISDAMGNPLDFSQGRFFPYLNGGIIAATPSMHRAILAALRKFREEGTKIEHVH
ncbi:hypothetical protein KSW81_007948 [Nannochloris sp. 'desiccata']|nr:hypothetical protein KSW81_007948 [Chlorella desiccata (nom. nud.)]